MRTGNCLSHGAGAAEAGPPSCVVTRACLNEAILEMFANRVVGGMGAVLWVATVHGIVSHTPCSGIEARSPQESGDCTHSGCPDFGRMDTAYDNGAFSRWGTEHPTA